MLNYVSSQRICQTPIITCRLRWRHDTLNSGLICAQLLDRDCSRVYREALFIQQCCSTHLRHNSDLSPAKRPQRAIRDGIDCSYSLPELIRKTVCRVHRLARTETNLTPSASVPVFSIIGLAPSPNVSTSQLHISHYQSALSQSLNTPRLTF